MNNPAIKEDHSFHDFLYWNLFLAVPLFTAILAIFKHSLLWMIFYMVVCVSMLIVICRFFCTHCPHYNKNITIKCMFFWGLPKFFDYRPGPYKFRDKFMTALATVVLLGFPVFWFLMEPGLLIIYVLSLIVFLISVRRNECARCVNHHCPANSIPKTLSESKPARSNNA